jgi:hypothetical protein
LGIGVLTGAMFLTVERIRILLLTIFNRSISLKSLILNAVYRPTINKSLILFNPSSLISNKRLLRDKVRIKGSNSSLLLKNYVKTVYEKEFIPINTIYLSS